MKRLLLLLLPVGLLAQVPAAPANLKIASATNKQVVFTWSASTGATSYAMQRRPLGGVYASLSPSAATTTFTDATIDAYTTYSYRVFAISTGGTSAASNEVQMGPPSVGFSMVSLTPTKAFDPGQYGRQVSMALDSNGDPAIAFIYQNPSNAGTGVDSTLNFVGWDRANYQWKSPVKVDVSGIANPNATTTLSMASDPSTGRLGVLYQKNLSTTGAPDQLGIAFSTDFGATWTVQAVPVNGKDSVASPSLALAGGQVYLAFWQDTATVYFTGSQTTAASSWTKTAVPSLNPSGGFRGPLSLALDSSGKPGVAYWFDETGGPSIGFWRPGNATSTRVLASKTQNDSPDLRLTFSGASPRVLFFGYLSSNTPPFSQEVWTTQSTDGGSTWTKPVALPNDGSSDWQGPLAFANNSSGFATAVAIVNSGNNSIPAKCGFPKWSQSADLNTWKTCSPQGPGGHPILGGVTFPSAVYGANDKIYFAFLHFDATNAELPTGVVLYREPLVAGQIPPNLGAGGVVNGASFAQSGAVAPGSIISIFGTNIAGAAGGSTSVPLSTALVDASVSIAGRLAPLYYVSLGQINAQLPFETPTGPQQLSGSGNGLKKNNGTWPVANPPPGSSTRRRTTSEIGRARRGSWRSARSASSACARAAIRPAWRCAPSARASSATCSTRRARSGS